MTAPLLQVDKIEVVYKRVITAVQGVTLSVGERQIVTILGTNGAGKTTTLRAISGFLGIDDARITEGTVTFKGTRIEKRTAAQDHRQKESSSCRSAKRCSQSHSRGKSRGFRVPRRAFGRTRLSAYFFPPGRTARPTAGLSGGERQMLAIGAALMCRPNCC
jgi:branched-chain amino acid transport system ATP-binding protein